jgi:hypothetical protein
MLMVVDGKAVPRPHQEVAMHILGNVRFADMDWRTSSVSAGGDCVQVAVYRTIAVRHSQAPDGPVLLFTPSEWKAFCAGVRHGEFDAPEAGFAVK